MAHKATYAVLVLVLSGCGSDPLVVDLAAAGGQSGGGVGGLGGGGPGAGQGGAGQAGAGQSGGDPGGAGQGGAGQGGAGQAGGGQGGAGAGQAGQAGQSGAGSAGVAEAGTAGQAGVVGEAGQSGEGGVGGSPAGSGGASQAGDGGAGQGGAGAAGEAGAGGEAGGGPGGGGAGQGGSAGGGVCKMNDRRCTGLQPEVCTVDDAWGPNGGECGYGCDGVAAACTCEAPEGRYLAGMKFYAKYGANFPVVKDTLTGKTWLNHSYGVAGTYGSAAVFCSENNGRLPSRAEIRAILSQQYPAVSCGYDLPLPFEKVNSKLWAADEEPGLPGVRWGINLIDGSEKLYGEGEQLVGFRCVHDPVGG